MRSYVKESQLIVLLLNPSQNTKLLKTLGGTLVKIGYHIGPENTTKFLLPYLRQFFAQYTHLYDHSIVLTPTDHKLMEIYSPEMAALFYYQFATLVGKDSFYLEVENYELIEKILKKYPQLYRGDFYELEKLNENLNHNLNNNINNNLNNNLINNYNNNLNSGSNPSLNNNLNNFNITNNININNNNNNNNSVSNYNNNNPSGGWTAGNKAINVKGNSKMKESPSASSSFITGSININIMSAEEKMRKNCSDPNWILHFLKNNESSNTFTGSSSISLPFSFLFTIINFFFLYFLFYVNFETEVYLINNLFVYLLFKIIIISK